MPEEGLVDVKFRLYDGSDMGPFQYASSSIADSLKQRIVSDWPKAMLLERNRSSPFSYASVTAAPLTADGSMCCLDCWSMKSVTPKAANEIKLISSGKVLENNKTVGQCKSPFGDVAGGCIVMHVVVQPFLDED